MAEPGSSSSLGDRRGRSRLAALATGVADKDSKAEVRTITLLSEPGQLNDLFDFQEKLFESNTQSKVFRATCKKTSQDVIVKLRSKQFSKNGEKIWRSLLTRMLNLEEHTNVLGLQGVFEDDSSYYIVMQRCSGGELFDFLNSETDVPERECKRIMREILEAVDHIHSQGLIHRDIKPENIMFHDATADEKVPSPKSAKKTVKLIDYDTVQEYEPMSPKAKNVVGTMGYIAPEALQGEYSPLSDLWSVGVILYILMTGDMPFGSDIFSDDLNDTRCGSSSMTQLYSRLQSSHIDFECEPWPSFPMAKDLCEQLLRFSPGDRSPSARHALSHPWLRG
mmetsp:Transcript_137073/g.292762  ORF Transcript_137073/g.292762 Transcript_137073/m.292762 type:complete len:336 (+) Transcript_137073:67-1074(+)